jgi:hypothetical protein
MLRAGLVPAAVVGAACVVVSWIAAGPGAAAAALGGAVVVLVALAIGPMVFSLTRDSSPTVTFVVGVLAFFMLVAGWGMLLVALIEVDGLPAGHLAASLVAGILAGAAGMVRWSVRARMPVYEVVDAEGGPPA